MGPPVRAGDFAGALLLSFFRPIRRRSRTPRCQAIERRIETLQGQLDLIAGRRAEAETALRLEQDRQSEHFSLLERATIPPYPASGGGRKIAAAGAIASVLMALALAFLLDVLRPVLRCSSQMERALGIRPVVAIPQLPKPSRRP